ncbi:hypothetical protein PPMP20_04235 [Paraburkholderia phymatum]|uniref:Uncharacterized protein n=1 Tax=Paraburkholderia phymatum (strain DSM 17167 / CIP 108236 / LMG 21445 / STM815) TaxID=391038 RepID=B2JD44_PARP8|nr:hypothetical protein [Paraburkholderia phymatum]ACC71100.1 hypothetical protein Bphy_1921 [Paraburkholderia phymatum STM815]
MSEWRDNANRAAARRLGRLSRYGSRRIKSAIRYYMRRQRKHFDPHGVLWYDDAYVLDLVLERIPF